jgi:hypothetical protein
MLQDEDRAREVAPQPRRQMLAQGNRAAQMWRAGPKCRRRENLLQWSFGIEPLREIRGMMEDPEPWLAPSSRHDVLTKTAFHEVVQQYRVGIVQSAQMLHHEGPSCTMFSYPDRLEVERQAKASQRIRALFIILFEAFRHAYNQNFIDAIFRSNA